MPFFYAIQIQDLIRVTTGHILKVAKTLQLLAGGAVTQAALLTGRQGTTYIGAGLS